MEILGDSSTITVNLNDQSMVGIDINKARTRMELAKAGISAEFNGTKTEVTFVVTGNAIGSKSSKTVKAKKNPVPASPKKRPAPKRHEHTYLPPAIATDVMDALIDDASHVLWFAGPTGTGKTVLAHHLAKTLGMELFQINCHGQMDDEAFFGDKTVEIDEASGQNKLVFKEGPVLKAMQAGLDSDGNEIQQGFDDDGNPVGRPGLLFIDEAGAMPSHISIGLNRLLESDNPRRTVTVAGDGGRVVKSHSKFRIIMAANTTGRGATDMRTAQYTAQMKAQDISLLNRVAMTFKFGYSRKVEKSIAMEKIGNDKVVAQVLKFRDAIRDSLRAGQLSTPFSTRSIVQISDAYRVYNDLAKAIYYTTFEQLLPEEKAVYNEKAVAMLGVDILKKFVDNDMDYMD
jgi:MoxR-like ATPase